MSQAPTTREELQAQLQRAEARLESCQRAELQLKARLAQHAQLADDWHHRAEMAVRAGGDDLARMALAAKKDALALAQAVKDEIRAQREEAEQLVAAIATLRARLGQAADAPTPGRSSDHAWGSPPPQSGSGGFSALPSAPNPIALLDDRVRLRLPRDHSLARSRQGGIMGFEVSVRREEQAWVVVPAPWGRARVAVVAIDGFERIAGPISDVVKTVSPGIARSVDCPVHDEAVAGDRTTLIVPETLQQPRNDILLGHLLVPHPDGTLLYLNFLTDAPTARNDPEGLRRWMRDVAATVEPGSRSLEVGQRTQTFGADPGEATFAVNLPPGLVWDTDVGPDFVVHRCQALVPVRGEPWVFKVYLGEHPSPMYRSPPPGARVRAVPGRLLGEDVSWHEVLHEGLFRQELLQRVSVDDERSVFLHAFGTTELEHEAWLVRILVGAMYRNESG